MRVLWAAMVYENDLKYLSPYIESALDGTSVPTDLLIIDAGSDHKIKETVSSFGDNKLHYFSLDNTNTNRGFNPSFNFAVNYAILHNYNALATMTVRAIADKNWLLCSMKAMSANSAIGMVTTLHVNKSRDRIHNLGHFLSDSGGLYDYGRELSSDLSAVLFDALQADNFDAIWAPCCGGAVYSVEALRIASESISKQHELFHPYGFKSYNCSHLGYLMKAFGFTNTVVPDAVCIRDDSESTSRNPNSCALLINQELNRLASVYTFWPKDMAQNALKQYLSKKRRTALSPLDRRIIITLAANLTRAWEHTEKIRALLERHLGHFNKSINIIDRKKHQRDASNQRVHNDTPKSGV